VARNNLSLNTEIQPDGSIRLGDRICGHFATITRDVDGDQWTVTFESCDHQGYKQSWAWLESAEFYALAVLGQYIATGY
jgi:hypothetical protein